MGEEAILHDQCKGRGGQKCRERSQLHRGHGHPRQAHVPKGHSFPTLPCGADAFIEGPEREKLSKPYVLYPREGQRPFALAGIWDEWCDPSTGERVRSFAVLTTVSNALTQAVGHHRAPVILDPDREREWLHPDTPLQDVASMLGPWEARRFNAYPISPSIRDPRRNGSHLLQAVGPRIRPEFPYEIHNTIDVFGMGESPSRKRKHASAQNQERQEQKDHSAASPLTWGHQGSLFD